MQNPQVAVSDFEVSFILPGRAKLHGTHVVRTILDEELAASLARQQVASKLPGVKPHQVRVTKVKEVKIVA